MPNHNIGIIDYGMGNCHSVANAFKEISLNSKLTNNAENIKSFDKIILPGVGAFQKAMENITQDGLLQALNEFKNTGKAILGICLGIATYVFLLIRKRALQRIRLDKSEVEKLPEKQGYTVPHIGWNDVISKQNHVLFNNMNKKNDFYFVHSFCVTQLNKQSIIGVTDYTDNFCSAFSHENVFGVQFHGKKPRSRITITTKLCEYAMLKKGLSLF